jgi:hypothetical protein
MVYDMYLLVSDFLEVEECQFFLSLGCKPRAGQEVDVVSFLYEFQVIELILDNFVQLPIPQYIFPRLIRQAADR